ncbi:glycoside hydrolase family 16 protein [Flagelloscypha sp. PMI_526]|nr:glycoside hydrolase family 16 protein [Flagelloscypha sp. PMI_526]
MPMTIEKEDDDWLHNPDPKLWAQTKHLRRAGFFSLNWRGFRDVGCLAVLILIIFGAFVGYPVTSAILEKPPSTNGAFNIGGLNASGQVPEMTIHSGLIDKDTPKEAHSKKAPRSGKQMTLVFSDEFSQDGRSFYPGDDPYWEAVDLHYWQTNNLEWYDPGQITTKDGHLEIRLERADATHNHNLNYKGGMMATWNKFCFTGGYVEASVTLPGANNVNGLWPAIWMMGNLGRAGYGASLDGLWPYSYDSCDVGTLKNQSLNGVPAAATTEGDPKYANSLSYLSGQRLSACTCSGQDDTHPGPKRGNSYVGRAAPEIDFFEAQVEDGVGKVSQSAQFAPFDEHYSWNNATNAVIENPSISKLNGFKGNVYQEATSVVTTSNQNCYEFAPATGCFATYGVEYKPGFDNAYISWINDGSLAWTLLQPGIGSNSHVGIGPRSIPQEPMYLIMNLGMSQNFGTFDPTELTFPATMKVDWIRVYQEEDQMNIGCSPKDFPTEAYISRYSEAYTNPNLTTWTDSRAVGGFEQTVPLNGLTTAC